MMTNVHIAVNQARFRAIAVVHCLHCYASSSSVFLIEGVLEAQAACLGH